MSPKEVEERWPKEYELIEKLIRNHNASHVKVIRKRTTLSLVEAKRIVLAIQNGLSLEEYESSYLPFIKEYIEELENKWR